MRVVFLRLFCGFIIAILAVATPSRAQQDPFRWMDFHSQKDQDIIVWVTRSLAVEDWTAIREIGVQYDAALVVTTLRPTPQSPANADTFTVWSVSLTSHVVAPLLKGVNLRWLDRMRFANGEPRGAGRALRQLPRLRGANLLHVLLLRSPAPHVVGSLVARRPGSAAVERQPRPERALDPGLRGDDRSQRT